MIELKNVYLSYVKEYFTLNDINLTVDDNSTVIIFGPKESGKSSLLRVMAGIEKATKGEVYIKNININKLNYKNDISMGYIAAKGTFFENKSVQKNLEYVLKIRKFPKESIQNKVSAIMLKNQLSQLKDTKLKDLSQLDRIKVSISRTQLRKLELLIVDDVFEDLTLSEAKEIVEMIKSYLDETEMTCVLALSNDKLLKYFNKAVVKKISYGSLEN